MKLFTLFAFVVSFLMADVSDQPQESSPPHEEAPSQDPDKEMRDFLGGGNEDNGLYW